MLSDYLCNIKSAPTVTEWENMVRKLMLFNGVMLPATECHGIVISNAPSYEGKFGRTGSE
jgi:hypothetical protein